MLRQNVRNFCIIAHIDHGKSTLADRFLELTSTVADRKMQDQLLDTMDLERERGITIKLQPATMTYKYQNEEYLLNLIDTPGHVDFNYEVSRSLAAVEGAILLIDATQGIQAQTLTNLYLAVEQGLEIIPVLNKIDLPLANVEKVSNEVMNLLGCERKDILAISAKTGENIEQVLIEVIEKIPAPKSTEKQFRALIFDSIYNEYKGVINYIRVKDGIIKKGDHIIMNASKVSSEVLELGVCSPNLVEKNKLEAGDIGYIITGIKEIQNTKVGDTIFKKGETDIEPLAGYKEMKPMVYASFFTAGGDQHNELRKALEKLQLNDASLRFEPAHSVALGSGFRCGFLGLLHLEIVQERLNREYDLDLIVTVPGVAYKVKAKSTVESLEQNFATEQILNDKEVLIANPAEWPDVTRIESIEEPIVKVEILTPSQYIGNVMQLVEERRGNYVNTEYIHGGNTQEETRAVLTYEMPLSQVIVDFYDTLKSVTSGYASLNYEFLKYQPADVVKMTIYIADDPVESLSVMVYRDEAMSKGKEIVKRLKKLIPRQMFVIKIQALVGGKIVAAERLSALRKDVTAKLYGGDVTRKLKLLKKQKEGKKRMAKFGKVNLPQSVYLSLLKKE